MLAPCRTGASNHAKLSGKSRWERGSSGMAKVCTARAEVRSNYMLVTAMFSEMEAVARNLLKLGVDTKHRYMRDCSGLADGETSFPRAARAEEEVLHLPAYPELSEDQIDRVAEKVEKVVGAREA